MDLSMKEALGLIVAVVAVAVIIGALLHFGLFEGIGKAIEGVT